MREFIITNRYRINIQKSIELLYTKRTESKYFKMLFAIGIKIYKAFVNKILKLYRKKLNMKKQIKHKPSSCIEGQFCKNVHVPILVGYFDAIPIKLSAGLLVGYDKSILDLYGHAKIKKCQDSFGKEKQMANLIKL